MHLSIGDILNLTAGLQLFLIIVILLHRGGKNLPNKLLAFFFFSQALVYLSIVWIHNYDFMSQNYPYLAYLVEPLGFTWGPTMFLFVKSQITQQFYFKKEHIFHYSPAILFYIYLFATFHIKSIDAKRELLSSYNYLSTLARLVISISIIAQVFIYNLIAVLQLRAYKLNKKNWSNQENYSLHITQFLLYGYFIACIIHDINLFVRIAKNELQASSAYNYFSLFVFATYFMIVIYKLVSTPKNLLTGKQDKKSRNLTINSEQIHAIIAQTEKHMLVKKPFLEFNYSLNQLADEISIKPRELSQAINEIKKQNFYDFINTYRINEAKNLLVESIENKQTILEIIYASGFNSKTAFNVAFKKQTGLTPSQFKNKHKT